MPPVTRALIIANVIGFVLELALGEPIIDWFALWPGGGSGLAALPLSAPWQLVSYSFLHGSLWHLAFNMFGLWMFGSELERLWGARRYLICYFSSVLSGALTQLLVAGAIGGVGGPVIGASAGVFGLLLGFAMYFPYRTVVLLFPPIPMPARIFVLVYALVELTLGVTGTQAGVAHFAHLGGMLGAYLSIQSARGRFPFGWR